MKQGSTYPVTQQIKLIKSILHNTADVIWDNLVPSKANLFMFKVKSLNVTWQIF